MLCIDLFCGWGGWARGFIDAGYEVVGFDIDPYCRLHYPGRFVKKDIRKMTGYDCSGARVIVASPPCDDYARFSMPWCDTRFVDTALWRETERVISEAKPRYWCIENVRGAQSFHGKATAKFGSRYLWGEFPILNPKAVYGKEKLPPSRDRKHLRAVIPYSLAYSLAKACSL